MPHKTKEKIENMVEVFVIKHFFLKNRFKLLLVSVLSQGACAPVTTSKFLKISSLITERLAGR